MRIILSALAVFALCASAGAQENPALLITDGGYYYIIVDDDGVPTVEEVDNVIDFRENGEPAPPTPPEPPNDDEDHISVRVQQWAEEVDHPQGARALSVVYKTIADNVDSGALDHGDAFVAIKRATDRVLDTVGGEDRWDGFREKLGDVIIGEMQRGGLNSRAEVSKFLYSVFDGLDAVEGSAEALDPQLIQLIIQLIIQIINMFGGGSGGGPV